MKRTPLYERHVKDQGKMVEFAGFDMPIQFEKVMDEHHHVRNSVGVFDVSHMGEVYIVGHEATKYLDYLLTNNVAEMHHDQCLYTMMCYEDGNVVDDLLVYKYTDMKYLLVINASNDQKDVDWMRKVAADNDFDVEVEHVSDHFGELAVQGPKAETLMVDVFGDFIKDIKFFTFRELVHDDIPLIISRTGYTGEDGFEVFMPAGMTETVYDKLFAASDELKPIGLGARDTLRFEVALPLYGHEINDQINPVEARLTYFVDFDKEDFLGKEAMLACKADEERRALVGFVLQGKGIAREHYPVFNEADEEIGFVTTGYKLDGYEGAIGLAIVPRAYSKLESKIYVGIRKKRIEAVVVKRKFYDKKYKK